MDVPAAVSDVVTGGYRQADGRGGHYRIVVATMGFEALASRVFVERVAEPTMPDEGLQDEFLTRAAANGGGWA